MVLALVTVPPLINSSPSLDALADTVTLPELVKVPSLPNSNIQEGKATRRCPRKDTAANRIGDAAAADEYLDLAEHRRLRRDCFAVDDAATEDIQEADATRVR